MRLEVHPVASGISLPSLLRIISPLPPPPPPPCVHTQDPAAFATSYARSSAVAAALRKNSEGSEAGSGGAAALMGASGTALPFGSLPSFASSESTSMFGISSAAAVHRMGLRGGGTAGGGTTGGGGMQGSEGGEGNGVSVAGGGLDIPIVVSQVGGGVDAVDLTGGRSEGSGRSNICK